MKSITNFPTTPYADLKHTLTYDEKLKENINKVFVKNKTLKMAKSVSSSFNSTTCNYWYFLKFYLHFFVHLLNGKYQGSDHWMQSPSWTNKIDGQNYIYFSSRAIVEMLALSSVPTNHFICPLASCTSTITNYPSLKPFPSILYFHFPS